MVNCTRHSLLTPNTILYVMPLPLPFAFTHPFRLRSLQRLMWAQQMLNHNWRWHVNRSRSHIRLRLFSVSSSLLCNTHPGAVCIPWLFFLRFDHKQKNNTTKKSNALSEKRCANHKVSFDSSWWWYIMLNPLKCLCSLVTFVLASVCCVCVCGFGHIIKCGTIDSIYPLWCVFFV